MIESEPLWLHFGESAQVSLRRMPDGLTVHFEVITVGDSPTLVLSGNAHLGNCDLSVTPDGLCILGLGLCVVPIVNDSDTIQSVAQYLGIRPPVLNLSHVPSQQRLLA